MLIPRIGSLPLNYDIKTIQSIEHISKHPIIYANKNYWQSESRKIITYKTFMELGLSIDPANPPDRTRRVLGGLNGSLGQVQVQYSGLP